MTQPQEYPARDQPPDSFDPARFPGRQAMQPCAFHPDRPTALHCSRCGRPACAQCLTPAAVGAHCRDCVAQARGTRASGPRTIAGARPHQQPLLVYTLIAVNVLLYVVEVVQSKDPNSPDGSSLFDQGTLIPDVFAGGQWWRVISSGFLHLSLVHIALNMVSLYFVGLPLERVLGRGRFVVVYFLALLGGSAFLLVTADPTSSSAGASGAIFGLFGALAVTFRRLKLDMRQIGAVLVLNLAFSFAVPGISWQAHIGGLIVGAAAGAVMVYPPQRTRKAWQLWGSVGLLVIVTAVIVGYAVAHTSTYCTVQEGPNSSTVLVGCPS